MELFGIIRINVNGAGKNYLRKPNREKDIEICNTQVVDIPVIKKYSITEFINEIGERIRKKLPKKMKNVKILPISDKDPSKYVRLWYKRRNIHFEVWLRAVLEIGLHLEASKKKNINLYKFFKHQERNIKRRFPEVKFSKFGPGWRKIYLELPKKELTEDFVKEVSIKMLKFMKVLYPLLKNKQIVY